MTPGEEPLSGSINWQRRYKIIMRLFSSTKFEEVFTQCKSRIQRQTFFDRLLELAKQMRLITTMRADFWGDCGDYETAQEIMQPTRINLTANHTRAAAGN